MLDKLCFCGWIFRVSSSLKLIGHCCTLRLLIGQNFTAGHEAPMIVKKMPNVESIS